MADVETPNEFEILQERMDQLAPDDGPVLAFYNSDDFIFFANYQVRRTQSESLVLCGIG